MENMTLIKGALPLGASLIFIIALIYVGTHKLKRILLYNIGKIHTDAEVDNGKLSLIKALMLFKNRLMRDKLAAIIHTMIMIGFVLFLIGYLANAVQVIFYTLSNTAFLKGNTYDIITLISSIGITLMLLGSISAILRRLSGKTARLGKDIRHIMPLVVFLFAALAGLFFEGVKNLLYQTGTVYSFAGKLFSVPLKAVLPGGDLLHNVYTISWYFLTLAAIILLVSLIKSKMPHMSAAMLNLMSKEDSRLGALKNSEKQISDFYKNNIEMDDNASFGLRQIKDFNRSQLNQLDACAECGRCDSVCPAHLSNKKLSPRKLILANREVLNRFKRNEQSELVSSSNVKEMIWECSMCYACENECPSLIEHVDRISGIRRNLVMEFGETLPELKKVLGNINKSENSFGIDSSVREKLLNELGIPYLQKGQKVDYVLWLGCHVYFDDRMKSVVESMLNILKKAGKTYAVLKDETCCGDPVRRIGDEFKFQEILNKNNRIFLEYEVSDILTICPHCFNTFKNEYPTLGSTVRAFHYLEILGQLVGNGNGNKLDKGIEKKRVFYHDSCYLGRINKLYNQPRQLLELLKCDYELVTIKNEKEDSMCCGGGGGRIWCEEKIENRPSMIKLKMLKEKNVDIIVTSCPYCLSIFSDAKNHENSSMEVMDLMELLNKSS